MGDERRIGRRTIVGGGLIGAALAGPAEAQPSPASRSREGGLRPGVSTDQSVALGRALAAAAAEGRDLRLPAGEYRVGGVTVPPHTRLVGTPGLTILIGTGAGPVLAGEGPGSFALSGLVLRGAPGGAPDVPTIRFADATVDLTDLAVSGAAGTAIYLERCGGRVGDCAMAGCDVAIFSRDATGLRLAGNTIRDCADNGIMVWRSAKGFDGTLVSGNRIERVRNRSGGSGEYGNGVGLFRAGGVVVSGNAVRDCAFSAVRNNSGDDVAISGNTCTRSGEVGIFVEFAFEGCVVSGNVIDGASVGISLTNLNEGGHLATATGNVVRNLFRRPDALTGIVGQGVGIAAEADAAVTGNVIEAAEFAGIWIGFGPHQRDVLCSANVVRRSPIGIAASVAPGAGTAHIAGNLLSGCARGAVLGFSWNEPAGGDFARGATPPPHLVVAGNTVRP